MFHFLVSSFSQLIYFGDDSVARMCGGADILGAIKFVMTILDAVFTIVPIILILLIVIDFAKNVIAKEEGDMKKNLSLAIKRLVMCIALFLIVPIAHAFIKLVGENGQNFLTCFDIAINEDVSGYSISDLFDFDSTAEKKDSGSQKYAPGTKDDVGSGDSANDADDAKDEQNDLRKQSGNVQNIFVGDSRTCGMRDAVGGSNDYWICEISTGLSWMNSTAVPKIDEYLSGKTTKYNIYFNFGVNDPGNVFGYIKKYQELVKKYSDHRVVIVSVNPINDSLASGRSNITNKMVVDFNNLLSKASGINYCDTYSLISNNFETEDGIHYKNATYRKIYNAMKECA